MIEGAGLSLRIVLGALNNGITPAREHGCVLNTLGYEICFTTRPPSAMNTSSRLFAILHFAKASCFFRGGRYSWRTVPTAACESQLMRRRRIVYESRGQPRLLEAGREEGPRPATMHPGAGVSLVDGARTMVCSAQVRGKHLHPSLATPLVRQRQQPKTLRCKSRGSEWLSFAQCGFDSGFRRLPPGLRPSSPVGHSFATEQAIFAPAHILVARCSSCVANRGMGSRSTPERSARKGLKLQPNAWLGWLGWTASWEESRWRAGLGTWHG